MIICSNQHGINKILSIRFYFTISNGVYGATLFKFIRYMKFNTDHFIIKIKHVRTCPVEKHVLITNPNFILNLTYKIHCLR
jgi:uncharacterized protein YxjI